MIRQLTILSLATLAYSCNPFSGTLDVSKSFSLKVDVDEDEWEDDMDWATHSTEEVIRLRPGSYSMKVVPRSSKEVTLKVKVDGTNQAATIQLPNGRSFPEYSGDIDLSASETGQDFGITGYVETQESKSDIYDGEETCYKTVRARQCDGARIHDRRDRDHRDRRDCDRTTRTLTGTQEVEYYYHYTDSSMDLELVSSSGRKLADFSGDRHSSDKIYTYKGTCHIDRSTRF